MRDKREQLRIYKELCGLMIPAITDKDSIIRIMKALQTKGEEGALKAFLESVPNATEYEIYEKMAEITRGRVEAEFSFREIAKRQYIDHPTLDNLRQLFYELDYDPVYVLENWNLTEDEQKQFVDAEIGDTISIETIGMPVLSEDHENKRILIPVYSSDKEIAPENKRIYTTANVTLRHMAVFAIKLSEELNRDVGVILDRDGNKSVLFTLDMLKKQYDMDFDFTQEESDALAYKVEHISEEVMCPRCGKKLIYRSFASSSEVKCETYGCIHCSVRGL